MSADTNQHSSAELLARAAREPLGVDISDFSDEWCEGFLKGQVNALEESGLLEQYERISRLNAELTRDYNALNVEEGRLREQLEAAQHEAKGYRETLLLLAQGKIKFEQWRSVYEAAQ